MDLFPIEIIAEIIKELSLQDTIQLARTSKVMRHLMPPYMEDLFAIENRLMRNTISIGNIRHPTIVLEKASTKGSFVLVQKISMEYKIRSHNYGKIFIKAACNGHLNIVKYLYIKCNSYHKSNLIYLDDIYLLMRISQYVDVLKFILKIQCMCKLDPFSVIGPRYIIWPIECIAATNDEDCFQLWITYMCDYSDDIHGMMAIKIKNYYKILLNAGHWQFLWYILRKYSPLVGIYNKLQKNVFRYACLNGHIELSQHLRPQYHIPLEDIFYPSELQVIKTKRPVIWTILTGNN